MNINERGFVHLFIIIAVVIVALGSIGYSIYKNANIGKQIEEITQPTPPQGNEDSQNDSSNNQQTTVSPTITSTSKPTTKPTQKLTATPTNSSSSGSSCNYNTSAGTGAVKVNIQASSGTLVGDQTVELQAQSGCKVLVNMSTDKDTRVARQGSPSVDFSSVPAGSYSIRAQYKGQWTGYQAISVNSGQLTTTTITVSGDTPTNPPTPSPKPKPRCLSPVIYPSSTGVAPFNALLQPQGYADLAGGIAGYEWDFIGDGSWDTSASPNAQYYTYQPAGTYTVKMRVLATNGEYSDTCQSTVTVN